NGYAPHGCPIGSAASRVEGAASSGFARLLFRFLVCADDLRLLEDVSPHGAFHNRLLGLVEITKHFVERVELEEVPVSPDRWAWAAVSGALPVILALPGARRQLLRSLCQCRRGRRDVVEHPM